MALSPDDIVNHEFKQTLRGYAVQEVDDLLDRLADQLERAELDIAELRKRVSEAEARTTEALATESSLKRTLITAQDAAQRTMDDARTHAETVRAEADRQVTERLDEAIARSTAMVQQAESEVHATRASYGVEHEATAARVAELAVIEERYRSRIRELLEHQLGEVERLEATGPPGGRELEQLRASRPRTAFDGSSDEGGSGSVHPDGGSDALDGSHGGSDALDGADDDAADATDADGREEPELVPFGGLTVRVANDDARSSDDADHGDDRGPDRDPSA